MIRSHYGDVFTVGEVTRVVINGQSMMDAVQKTLDEASFVDVDEEENKSDDDDQDADANERRSSPDFGNTHSTTTVANNDNIPSTTTTTQQNRMTESDQLEQDEDKEESLPGNDGEPGKASDGTEDLNSQANGEATEAEHQASTNPAFGTDTNQNSEQAVNGVEVEGDGRTIPMKDEDVTGKKNQTGLKDGTAVEDGEFRDL